MAPPAAAPATTSLPVVGHPRAVARAAALVADASVDQVEGVRGGRGGRRAGNTRGRWPPWRSWWAPGRGIPLGMVGLSGTRPAA